MDLYFKIPFIIVVIASLLGPAWLLLRRNQVTVSQLAAAMLVLGAAMTYFKRQRSTPDEIVGLLVLLTVLVTCGLFLGVNFASKVPNENPRKQWLFFFGGLTVPVFLAALMPLISVRIFVPILAACARRLGDDWWSVYGMSFFTPWFAFVAFLTLYPSIRIGRRAERKAASPWTSGHRAMRHALTYLFLFTLMNIFLLPLPLTFYCAYSATNSRPQWRVDFLNVTPDFTKLLVLRVDSWFPAPRWFSNPTSQIVINGRLSNECLTTMLQSSNEREWLPALMGIQNKNPKMAVEFSEKLISSSSPRTAFAGQVAGGIIATHAHPKVVRNYIATYDQLPPDIAGGFCVGIISTRMPRYVPDLLTLAQTSQKSRVAALQMLARVTPSENVETIWKMFAAHPDPLLRRDAIEQCAGYMGSTELYTVAALFIDDEDVQVRRAAVFSASWYQNVMEIGDPAVKRFWVAKIKTLLDDDDPSLVRGAISMDCHLPYPRFSVDMYRSIEDVPTVRYGGTPSDLNAQEEDFRKQVKESVNDWLTQHQ